MTENEFLLQDRIAKIKSMNDLHNLEDNAYIAFSGGKDSVALSEIVDIALPGNKFPRVYINTGIEYQLMVEYVKQRQISDERIIVIQPKVPIIPMLKEEGYPFKSKEFSQKLNLFQRKGLTKTVTDYLGLGEKKTFLCPSKLKVLFSDEYSLKISDHCCLKLKKEPSDIWARENRRPIKMTGMRSGELGLRTNLECAVFDGDSLLKFHPLKPITEEFVNWFIEKYHIRLCDLYYPPFNFKRTGCNSCPFSTKLRKQLEVLNNILPNEAKKAEYIWQPVYEIYRKIGYRLETKASLAKKNKK